MTSLQTLSQCCDCLQWCWCLPLNTHQPPSIHRTDICLSEFPCTTPPLGLFFILCCQQDQQDNCLTRQWNDLYPYVCVMLNNFQIKYKESLLNCSVADASSCLWVSMNLSPVGKQIHYVQNHLVSQFGASPVQSTGWWQSSSNVWLAARSNNKQDHNVNICDDSYILYMVSAILVNTLSYSDITRWFNCTYVCSIMQQYLL